LHGFTGAHADWQPVVGDDPVYCAIDLPGHGASKLNDSNAFFSPLFAKKHLSCSPFLVQETLDGIHHLIGYSFGGRLALALLHAAPLHFRSATIIAAHPGLTDAAQRHRRRAEDRKWIKLLRTEGIGAFVAQWEQQPLFATQRELPPEVLARQQARRLRQSAEGLADCLEQFGLAEMPNTWETLAHFSGRLQWIVGGADHKFLKIAQQVKAVRPKTELNILDGIGHNLLLESPKQLSKLIQRFMLTNDN
jgi:2-succinyl-6-hydroxy-2,4-cyclohexadiene-1-carboxylate synthase